MRKRRILACLAMIIACLSIAAQETALAPPLQWQPVDVPGLGTPVNTLIVSPHDSKRVLVGGRQFGIYWSADQGDSWKQAQGLSCFHVNSFLWHPKEANTVWAATMNGVYLSSDAGQTWEIRSDGMPVDAFSEFYTFLSPVKTIIMDPVNPQRLLAFCGVTDTGLAPRSRVGGVWETTNGGLRWRKLCTITLEGATDDPKAKGVNLTSASFAGGIPMLMYATSDEAGFFETIDGGKTWTPQNTGLPHTSIKDMWVEPKSSNTVWVALSSYKDTLGEGGTKAGGIYKTVSGGLTWFSISGSIPKTTKGKFQELSSFPVFAVSPENSAMMFTCDASLKAGTVYKTSDNAKSWDIIVQQRLEDDPQAEEEKEDAAPEPEGEPEKEEVTPPESTEKQEPEKPATPAIETLPAVGFSDITALTVDPKNPDVVFMAGSNFIMRTTDGGGSWVDLTAKPAGDGFSGRGLSGLDVNAFIWNPDKKGHLIIAAGNSMKFIESSDNGVSWQLRGTDPYYWGGGQSGYITGNAVFLGTGQFGLYGSVIRKNGDTWQTLTGKQYGLPPFKRSGQVTSVAIPSTNTVAAVIGGQLYMSVDNGDSWTVLIPRRDLGYIALLPGAAGYYVSGRKSCYLVKGKNATPIGGPKSAGPIVCAKDGTLYMAANKSLKSGVWSFKGTKWKRLLDEDFVSGIAVDPTDPKRIAVCTTESGTTANDSARGVWLSADGGETWSMANEGLILKQANAVTFDHGNPERLLLGTSGSGIFELHWPKAHPLEGQRRYVSNETDAKFSSKLAGGPDIDAPPGSKPSPLKNGNMEVGNTIPASWTSRWVGKGRILVARDPSTSYDGEASLRIQTVGGPGKGQIAQIIPATGISELTLTAFIKSEGKVFAQVAVQSFDAKWKTLQYRTVAHFRKQDDWKKITGTVKLPPGTVRFGVGLLVEGDGKAWMDNVTLDVK